MSARTIIIGLDGATFDLIEPWVQAGLLPNLAGLIAEGVHGPLRAWPNLNSAAAWSSIVTGCNPGQHSIFDFGDAPPRGDAPWRPITAADRKQVPLWHYLNKGGQKVGVVNLPISYPADHLNGFMLAGMDAPRVGSPGFAHPPHLIEELRDHNIDYVIDVPNLAARRARDPLCLPASVKSLVETRARTILHLMEHHPWDVLMAIFTATDRVMHCYWPDTPVSDLGAEWGPIRELYRQLDAILGDILLRIDEETTVVVVSDHGFGPARDAKRCLNALFSQLGLLHYRSGGGPAQDRLLRQALLWGRKLIPASLQRPMATRFPVLRRRALQEHKFSGVDWDSTRAVAVSPEQVYVNSVGRQGEGPGEPGDCDTLRAYVRGVLLNLVDPATGERLVRDVRSRGELYTGPYSDIAADLTIEWEDTTVPAGLGYSGSEGEIALYPPERTDSIQRGAHESEGILIARGPRIKKGSTVSGAHIYDIAPTLLYLQDQAIPEGLDGTVLTEIFTENHRNRHPVRTDEAVPHASEPDAVQMDPADSAMSAKSSVPLESSVKLDPRDARAIEDRLRGLGYIE